VAGPALRTTTGLALGWRPRLLGDFFVRVPPAPTAFDLRTRRTTVRSVRPLAETASASVGP